MENQKDENNIPLTASELGFLWAQYVNDTLDICVMNYFQNICEDQDILPLVENSLSIAQKDIKVITEILSKEKHPIPVGFTDKDVKADAPRLYSDTFILMYIQKLEVVALERVGMAIALSARSDVSQFFKDLLYSVTELHDQARMVMLSKGVYVRPPQLPIPKKVDFVKRQSFLFDFLGQHKRPLSAIEVAHLFNNIQTNAMGKTIMMAFAQVCKNEDVKQFFLRGKEIAKKHMEKLSLTLIEEDIPAPMSWDTHVTDSTVAPFSDKLMAFQTIYMNAIGIGNYGVAAGTCQRVDLSGTFTRLAAEIALFLEDGTNILIKHGWFEEPPKSVDRQALADQPK
jgi:hypothetical protein